MLCSFQVYGTVVRLYFCILVQTFLTPSCQPTLSSPQPRGERRLLYLLHFSPERGTGNQIKGVWAFLGEEWKTAGCSQLTDKIGAAHWGLSKLLLVLMMVGETGGREGRGRETDCLLGSYEASLWLSWERIRLMMQETWVQALGWEDPLEKGKATHSSILA